MHITDNMSSCTGLLPEDSYKHSFPFCRSAFEVGSITPGTKVIISARRFQPFWRRKHATFRSQVDFATSAKSRSSRRASARRDGARNRSSSIELVGKPVLTLGRAAVSERQITLEGGLQAQNFAGRGCRRCCTMCSHRRILCEVVSHTNSASTLPAMAGKPSISGVPIWRVFHCQQCTQHMPPMVLIHWQLHSNTALCSCGLCCSLCVSPLFLPFGSNFKCSKRSKTR